MYRMSRGFLASIGVAGCLVLAACGSGAATGGSATSTAVSNSSAASAGSAGSSGGAQPAATGHGATAGGQTQLALSFNATCFDDEGATTVDSTGFDKGGTTLPATAVKPGDFTGSTKLDGTTVHFLIPAVGAKSKSCLQFAAGQSGTFTLNVPSGKYKEAFFLEGAGNGPGTVDLTFTYTDGTSDKATLNVDDWCAVANNKDLAQGAALVIDTDHRVKNDGSDNTGHPSGCGLIGIGTKVNAGKQLKGITLANPQPQDQSNSSFQPNIVAITLQP